MSGLTQTIGSAFGSSAKTDRNTQLSSQQGLWNVFGYGLPQSKESEETGKADLNAAKSTLGTATDYWRNLLTAGRRETAQRSAPAVNQVLENATANRNAEGTFGTDRTGGTVAANRESGERTQSKIDDIINATLNTGREEGARGLTSSAAVESSIGSGELSHALSMLGLSEDAVKSIMSNATASRPISYGINRQTKTDWGKAIGELLLGPGADAIFR